MSLSTRVVSVATTEETPVVDVRRRLGYLLKNAELRMAELNRVALAPLGIDGRELGVLIAIASEEPVSQQEAGRRLSVDRTTMVAFVDSLERKGLVSRHPDQRDRRRNIVELTDAGRATLVKGVKASE